MAATTGKENIPFFLTPPKRPTSEQFHEWRKMNDMIPGKENYKRQGLKEVRDFNRTYQDNLEKYKAKYKNCNEFKEFLETNFKGLYEIASDDFEDYKFKTSMQDSEASEPQPAATSQRNVLSDITNKDKTSSASKQSQEGGSKKSKHTKRNKRSKRTKKSNKRRKSNKRSKKR